MERIPTIDAHHHIWRLKDLTWLSGPQVPRIFGPYEAIRREASLGAAVLVITSDFEEIEALCSRAFVFVRGACKAELNAAEVSVPNIAACLVNRTQSTETASIR